MESMPDIVQLADDKAGIEEQQQNQRADFVPESDVPCQQVEHHQKYADDAAVHIGKAFLEVGFNGAAHVARYLPHSIQQTLPVVLLGNVQPEAGGEFVDRRLGRLQRRKGRQLQNRRHANGKDREKGDPHKIRKELSPAVPAANFIHEEQQEHKNTGKQADIVIGKHREEQRNGVQYKFLLLQQPDGAQRHQRQQGKCIQPHDIPLKSQRPGTEAIEAAKDGNGKIIFSKNVF